MKGYVIKDNHGCFAGSLGLSVKNMDGTGIEWSYYARRNMNSWYSCKELALAEIQQLEQLEAVAKMGLTWELIHADIDSFPRVNDRNMILNKDIPKGNIGKHKEAEREIRKKFKAVFAQIEKSYREQGNTVWCIQDENGHYVHRDSIRKVGKEYYYLSYQNLSDGCRVYTKRGRVEEALENLNLHNQCGCLGHEFTIVPVEI